MDTLLRWPTLLKCLKKTAPLFAIFVALDSRAVASPQDCAGFVGTWSYITEDDSGQGLPPATGTITYHEGGKVCATLNMKDNVAEWCYKGKWECTGPNLMTSAGDVFKLSEDGMNIAMPRGRSGVIKRISPLLTKNAASPADKTVIEVAETLMASGERLESAARGSGLSRADIEALLSRAEETYAEAARLFEKGGDQIKGQNAMASVDRVKASYGQIKDVRTNETEPPAAQGPTPDQCKQLRSTIALGKQNGVDVSALEAFEKKCP